MSFEEYLTQKKIDVSAFQAAEPSRFAEWQRIFNEIHPESFTAQKKFLINSTRRNYLLTTPPQK
ncbi:MAG: hypothetical protein QM669_10790 [Siphonobacter sp.]